MSYARITNYRRFLLEQLQARQMKNPSYSLRAFARDLEIPSSRLSEVLSAKVGISEERAMQIAEKLSLPLEDRDLFVDLVQSEHGRSAVTRKMANERVTARMIKAKQLEADQFSVIASWYYLPLIQLLKLPNVAHSPIEFASRLGISAEDVSQALGKMELLGLITFENGRYQEAFSDVTTTRDVPSADIRQYHRQVLEKAEENLEKRPMKERDYSSVVFAFNKRQIEIAKEKIRNFRRSLMKELEGVGEPDSVYNLSIQFFEMTENA